MGIVHCLLILSAHAILLKNVYSDPSNNPLANAGTVKSYTLVVTWPAGACSGDSGIKCLISPVPTEFKIHGLWPDPKGQTTEDFDARKIATLTTELNTNWPNLESKQQQVSTNLKFWENEWKTHGKFSELGVQGYFEKTLELFKNGGQGLKAKLVAEKITPTLFKTYKLQEIEAALKKINGGFSVQVVCNQRSTTQRQTQIQEVRFKFTKDFQKTQNSVASTCGTPTTDVIFAGTVESYTLAVTWPPGACSGDSGIKCLISPVPTEFKIHGLWPSPNGEPAEVFDANKIATLTTELNTNWPNLKSKQQQVSFNLKFWEDEWNKHGKFSELGVRGYFEKTLELFKNGGQRLKEKLVAENITPTLNKTYKLQTIEAALKKINGGFSVQVVCNQRSTNKMETQIQEVRFKFTNDFQKQHNVASTRCGTATTDVMFPA